MKNTIIMRHGVEMLTKKEFRKFTKGDTIKGENSYPEEEGRWSIEDKEEAKAWLSAHECTYRESVELVYIEEYALEYCTCDEDGEFVDGSDYDMAKVNYDGMKWGLLSEETKARFLANASAVDGITGNNVDEADECIIDLDNFFSVAGSIHNGEIYIDDNNNIYMSTDEGWEDNRIYE